MVQKMLGKATGQITLDVGVGDCQAAERVGEYRTKAVSNPGYNQAMKISAHWLASPQ